MLRPRRSTEEGHRRKFLVVIDDTPECSRAVLYGALRAQHTAGALVMLYVIVPGEFQHWIGVENIMRAEAMEAAEETLGHFADTDEAVLRIHGDFIRVGRSVGRRHQFHHFSLCPVVAPGLARDARREAVGLRASIQGFDNSSQAARSACRLRLRKAYSG